MIKLRHKFYITLLLLSLSSASYGLSVGEIKVKSTFAQPFLAEIELPSYTQKELKHLKISLSPKKIFDEQGIEVLPILKKFKFSIEVNKENKQYIRVKTKKPVKELSVSFLLAVSWRGGNIIKNYDVLLTPEAITQFREQTAKPVLANKSENPSSKTLKNALSNKNKPISRLANTNIAKAKPATKKRKSRKSTNTNRITINQNGQAEYGAVQRGEYLSVIAKKMREGRNISNNQMMIALFHENPEAFMKDDINRLKVGAKLKIKDINKVASLSKKEATQLAKQYLAGTKTHPRQNTEQIAKTDAIKPSKKPEALSQPKERLVISSEKEEPVPLDIIQKIKKEQLSADEENIVSNNIKAEELNSVNKTLKERISDLEKKRDAAAEDLFLATLKQETAADAPKSDSLTQQNENLLVTNTDLSLELTETLSLMQRIEKYQTAISISSVALLSITLIGIRKKEELLDIIHEFSTKFNRKT